MTAFETASVQLRFTLPANTGRQCTVLCTFQCVYHIQFCPCT